MWWASGLKPLKNNTNQATVITVWPITLYAEDAGVRATRVYNIAYPL